MAPLISTFEIILFALGVLALASFSVFMLIKAIRASKPIILTPQFNPSTIIPSQRDFEMIECSVNVIVIDEDGMMFIGFYAYNELGWVFMHDKTKPQGEFVWMYRPLHFKVN